MHKFIATEPLQHRNRAPIASHKSPYNIVKAPPTACNTSATPRNTLLTTLRSHYQSVVTRQHVLAKKTLFEKFFNRNIEQFSPLKQHNPSASPFGPYNFVRANFGVKIADSIGVFVLLGGQIWGKLSIFEGWE